MRALLHKSRHAVAVALCALGLAAAPADAAIVDLDAYVLNPILQDDGITPLADGSWVMIIGSWDGTIDPMVQIGPDYIAASVTGDDVILGIVQIDSLFGPGTFGTTVQYDSTLVNNVYIRFFDTTGPLTGMIWWGTSPMIGPVGVTLGVTTVQFDPGGSLQVDQENNFVIIPEPGTANLLLLVGGMIWAMRAKMARKKNKDQEETGRESS
ncbi:MAG TPA: hypothetical protein PKE12_07740 [Kiritimatiellia bacterium]|nr:hypothetical protein [Kiritimatiellia bacterium]